MSKYKIDATFKTFGAFWEPDRPNQKFTGSISSSKGKVEFEGAPTYSEMDLEARRAFFAEINSPPDLQGSTAICGTTTMGGCTLLNPIKLGENGLANFSTMEKLDRVRYRAMRTVMGLHIESSEANVLDSAAYYLTKIHHFLPTPWESKMAGHSMKYKTHTAFQEVFSCRSETLKASVVCEVAAGGTDHIKRGVRIKPVPRIRILPDHPQSPDWFIALGFRLENFFSLLFGTSIPLKYVQLSQGEEVGWVVQKVNARKEKINRQLWVQCEYEQAASALRQWFAVPSDDQLVELTLLGSLRNSKLYVETEFLTLVQALEGFGRIRFGGKKRRDIKFKDAIEKTYHLFRPETAKKISGEREAFVKKVIQTRDYYTHLGNQKGTSAAKTMKELFLLNKRLHAFLRGAMLIDLGIPEGTISNAVIYQATRWR